MADTLNDLEKLEIEISSYRRIFQESSEVLDDLAKIQREFEALSHKYQELQQEHQHLTRHIDEAKIVLASLQAESKSTITEVVQAQKIFNQRFADLENAISQKITQARESFNQRSAELEERVTTTEGAQEDLGHRLDELESTIEDRYAELRDRVFSCLSELDRKVEQQQVGIQKRLEALQIEAQRAEASLRARMKVAIFTGIFVALVLAVWPFFVPSMNRAKDRQVQPTQIWKPDRYR